MTDEDRLEHWLGDLNTWVGVFENHDLGHRGPARCAFPFSLSDGSLDRAEVDRTRAPDGTRIGFGWRYILIAKCLDAASAAAALRGSE